MKDIIIASAKERTLRFTRPGSFTVLIAEPGEYDFRLQKSGVDVVIYGLFRGHRKNSIEVVTRQMHEAPGTTSRLLVKSVLRDSSSFRYHGTIRIEKEAQQSHAYQKNQNLVCSPDVFVDSRPVLEILANDVFCTHGSTTGYVDEESLEYCMMRGIPRVAAEQLLITGFESEIVDAFPKVFRSS